MRKLFLSLMALVFSALLLSACVYRVHTTTTRLPPGQAKKVTGAKSAKAYAPGQQKKH